METPLTPLEFARRARRLYAEREAVVDGDLRLTYAQFFDRCDRWSAALQGLGVSRATGWPTSRPNTHAQLESFYAVPQIGAVLVPINYRLTADDFAYIINHSGAQRGLRARRLPGGGRRHPRPRCRTSSTSSRSKATQRRLARLRGRCWPPRRPDFERPEIAESDLLTINYTSGTTSRPKGRDDHAPQRLHERRRHAACTCP